MVPTPAGASSLPRTRDGSLQRAPRPAGLLTIKGAEGPLRVVAHVLAICGDKAMLRDEVVKAMAGRRAIVTGASKGCGATIARTLARAGMDMAIIGRNEAGLQRTKAEIEAAGRACLVVSADLSTTEGAKRA